jgi:hypothetical protein
MRSRQRGATFLGMVIIVAIVGFALYAGIRLLPIYTEYMGVVRALEQTSKDIGEGATPDMLRNALQRQWEVDDIKSLQPKDIEIRKVGGGYTLRAWYRAETPFVGNVSLVATFDKTVDVR